MFHVKHSSIHAPTPEEIALALGRAGIEANGIAVDLMASHAAAVLATNARLNLTRITEPKAFVRLHIVDSLMPWLYEVPTGPFVDVGSGNGYPGIPLAVVHGLEGVLCESSTKKATFLREWLAQTDLPVTVYDGRAETLARDAPGAATLVVARGVTQLGALVELAAPLLELGGRLVALKSDPGEDEVAAGARVASIAGLEPIARHDYTLPDGGERRCLVVYRKSGDSVVKLPRRPGQAQRRPIGL
jgi:16S rRNA (guanine527-N7)-methyltransferase